MEKDSKPKGHKSKDSKLKDNLIYDFSGIVTGFTAPSFAPGGPDGPAYVHFSLYGEKWTKIHFGVFYIPCSSEGGAEDAGRMATAFVTKETITVQFQSRAEWTADRDPSGTVLSIKLGTG